MKEQRIGGDGSKNNTGIEFTTDHVVDKRTKQSRVIAVFAQENAGKTRLSLTGPDGVGCVPLEMKAFPTLEKDAAEFNKRIYRPKDPMALIVSQRKVASLANEVEQQKFYAAHCKLVEDTMFGLLEHKEVGLVMMDKFSTYCTWKEFAVNGMSPKYVKIDGGVKQSKAEVRQAIIDFVNSLPHYGKPVILNCATKPDYDVTNAKGEPLRNTWDCGAFYMLGSHVNIVCELESNQRWKEGSGVAIEKWRYRLNVRRCQFNPGLEGPEGNPLLEDEMITLPNLMMQCDPSFDPEGWV